MPPARPLHRSSFPPWPNAAFGRRARLWTAALVFLAAAVAPANAERLRALAMHGEPALPADFAAFPYTSAEAPKGGRLTLGQPGSFDSLNPFIVKGVPAASLRDFVFETLLARSQDEPFTLYPLIAESIDLAPDRSEITFNIDPRARFSDGKPLTAADVLFSFEVLRERGRPNHRTYYKKVAKAERVSERAVRFVLGAKGDRELPLILGLMPILPSHKLTPETFEQTGLEPPVGSGPYRVARVDPGRSVSYQRDANYWGRDVAANRGRFNFEEVRIEYFRDSAAMFEAFKAGEIDFRLEEDPAVWAESYAFPALARGSVAKEESPIGLPAGMTGLVFNTRKAVFKDARVRQALILLFDAEWINRTLFHGLYTRTDSYFARSILSSAGRPASPRERELLAPFGAKVKPQILDGTFRFPASAGSGQNRANQAEAFRLLGEAGYRIAGGALVDGKGQRLAFEALASTPGQERLYSRFAADLARLGIAMRIRVVDSAQYQARLKSYDYDMIQTSWVASLSPGNEQLFRFSSSVADKDGSFNYAGVSDAAVDAMIVAMLAAASDTDFVAACRALDRVLLSGDYVIPLFYLPHQWIAYWRRIKAPGRTPLFGYALDTWWAGDGR
jgi:peptide/nickel transport system substrate-binding protein